MPYDKTQPNTEVIFKDGQGYLYDNFTEIDTVINVNHVGFNTGNDGKHNEVLFTERVTATIPETNAKQVALYTEEKTYTPYNSGVSVTRPELAVRKSNSSEDFFFTILNKLENSRGIVNYPSMVRIVSYSSGGIAGDYTVEIEDIKDTEGNEVFSQFYSAQITCEGIVYPPANDNNLTANLISVDNNSIQLQIVRRDHDIGFPTGITPTMTARLLIIGKANNA